jgi:uncharacterized protein YdeI (YjbR/CyaY-like superfamily)
MEPCNIKPLRGNPQWSEELALLASVIDKAPLEKTVKWGSDVFTFNGKNVLSYGGFKNYFALWFYNGVFLEAPYHVLVSAQEGVTKSLRQWRMTSIEQIDEAKILAYIHEAIEVEKKGLKLKPEKPRPIEIPQLLSRAFTSEPAFEEAFCKLTPGKQKEYIAHLNATKQEATQLNRLEKMKPMIYQGLGLNDKYK